MSPGTPQQFITARVGNRVIECPVSLLTQLQRERQAHCIDIGNGIGEAESNALLAEAEHIKDATHISASSDDSA